MAQFVEDDDDEDFDDFDFLTGSSSESAAVERSRRRPNFLDNVPTNELYL